ncbi:hypothetical protein ACMD2_09979 [Ananas comosus]|uniref:Uncharacterized protein n=1 Tax=Ananas comosus TaxID=4615 RepID=A0A199W990_ANACO|nr:hypothetical protein ACMD2_09979 [Ananas comosus]
MQHYQPRIVGMPTTKPPSLTRLLLVDLKMITRLPSADVLANLKSLQTLALSNCWALTSLGGIRSLRRLGNLLLNGCPCLDIENAVLPSSLQCRCNPSQCEFATSISSYDYSMSYTSGIVTVSQPPISPLLEYPGLFWRLILGGFAGTALSRISHSAELLNSAGSGEFAQVTQKFRNTRMSDFRGAIHKHRPPFAHAYAWRHPCRRQLRNMLCNVEKECKLKIL